MKSLKLTIISIAAALGMCGCASTAGVADDDTLVILHTNDTHSAIEPDRHDLGGIARRKVLVDSVRDARQNVLLVDAGDAVQGSLYYTLFSGEVERKMMNAMGYDIQILGNHEFDKGLEPLAREWKQLNATRLSTNYDVDGTPLQGLFKTSEMREFNGHKIGFIGINLDPEGIISQANYQGMKYEDAIERANAEAAALRNDGAEMVIAITHIGYDGEPGVSDTELARASRGIDVIIGGHSHTVIDPQANGGQGNPVWRFTNAEGKPVEVVQTGSSGVNLGEITINLRDKSVAARLIPVNSRLDSRIDTAYAALITPYRAKVDSVRSIVIGNSPRLFDRKSPEMLNLLSDFVLMRGSELCGKPVDLSIMNKGGIRNSLPEGPITQGAVIDIAPFDNSVVVLEIKGSDLLDNFGVMAGQEGNGVSSNVRVLYDPSTHEVNSATIDGKPVDPNRTYRLATIDYLAAGNDYMTPLTHGTEIAKSPDVLYSSLIGYISTGRLDTLLANPDPTRRMSAF